MPEVTEFAQAKVNLALHVLGRREDGYHELSSIVAFADFGDRLRIAEAATNGLDVSGPFKGDVPGDDSNIIWKAYRHLAELMPVPKVHVSLEKNLPVASGIGGGSADAAALLRGVLTLIGRKLTEQQISDLGKAVGADVPVCFVGKAARIEGIGERILSLEEKLPRAVVLVNPLVPCSTPKVFRAMGIAVGERPKWPNILWRNDMTEAALKVQPTIGVVLAALGKTKLDQLRMCGSGATCFGCAESLELAQAEAAALANAYPQWWVKAGLLK